MRESLAVPFTFALALSIFAMGLAPTAAADDHPWEPADPVLDEWAKIRDNVVYPIVDTVQDAVDQAVCEVLKGGSDTAWGCVQVFYCGGEHCIERKIWSP